MELRMHCDPVCNHCYAQFMTWLCIGHHYEIKEFRDMGKGG
jgi:hypothetical protein